MTTNSLKAFFFRMAKSPYRLWLVPVPDDEWEDVRARVEITRLEWLAVEVVRPPDRAWLLFTAAHPGDGFRHAPRHLTPSDCWRTVEKFAQNDFAIETSEGLVGTLR